MNIENPLYKINAICASNKNKGGGLNSVQDPNINLIS